jgi:phosphopantothenoylcysteine decarboxylase/phosphopantothenate--cysteine ligase
MDRALQGKHIVLGLSGGVACYKSAMLCRGLIKAGATVQVVMTESACQFISPVTMQALSNRQVFVSQWDNAIANNMAHINLSREADAIVIAPCSADLMAKLAQGHANDLLSLMCVARPAQKVPLLLAPAMNREMWEHPAVQRNARQLEQDGAIVLGVGQGDQACGETGDGRMLEPEELLHDIQKALTPPILKGQRWLITAGPTFEAIDPVRGITNRSSGKMGYSIAVAAQMAGAEVVLVSGPVALAAPRHIQTIAIESAQDMLNTCMPIAAGFDVFVACAAVADWRVANTSHQKIKKEAGKALPSLEFAENPDILASVAQLEQAQNGQLYCVGFAAESENLQEHARAKRLRKKIPLLVGNIGPATFGKDENALLLIDDQGSEQLPLASKTQLAYQLIDAIQKRRNA